MTCPIEIVDKFCGVKAPGEVKDFYIDYSTNVLSATDPSDLIATSSWVVAEYTIGTDLTIDSDSFVANAGTRIWVSGGGKLGTFHKLINTITTVGGRTHIRTILLWIQQ